MNKKPTEWKLEAKSYQIADTGDYDGHYELHIGNYVLHSRDEVEDEEWEEMEKIMQRLSEIGMHWWDPYEGVDKHIISWKEDQITSLYKFLKEKGLEEEYEQWYMTPRKREQDGKDN